MNLAVLFWFYKESEICKNRLKIIKKYNPNIKIFGLYGGGKKSAKLYQKELDGYLDDFYVSSLCDKSKNFKWINGDLMILDWYEKRGINLNWDSVVVVQWDMLVFDSFENQFSKLKKNQIFLSGARKLDDYIENKWDWTQKGGEGRKDYLAFKRYLQKQYSYIKPLLCCLFILEIFPKRFFKNWAKVPDRQKGMLEYRIPTYAKIFGIPFLKRDVGVWWFDRDKNENKMPLNALNIEIGKEYILDQLNKKNGFRIFHPYFKIWEF